MELFIGMDIHLENIQTCVKDKHGNTITERLLKTTSKEIQEFLENLPSKNITITMEACGLWRGIYKSLKGLGYKVILTSPKKVKDIAGVKKTDKVDASILADLLRTGYIPKVWIPDDEIIWLRDVVRHQTKLSWLETSTKNRIKARLVNKGYKYPKGLWKRENQDKLKNLDDFSINQFLEIKQLVETHLKEMGKMVKDIGKNKEEIELLRTITGIDYFAALLFYAEIGDVDRFESIKQIHSYAGLVPGVYQSANTSRSVSHKFRNRYLKWIAYTCATVAIKYEGPVRTTYQRVMKRTKNSRKARRAAARKLLTQVYMTLKNHGPVRTGQGHPLSIIRLLCILITW